MRRRSVNSRHRLIWATHVSWFHFVGWLRHVVFFAHGECTVFIVSNHCHSIAPWFSRSAFHNKHVPILNMGQILPRLAFRVLDMSCGGFARLVRAVHRSMGVRDWCAPSIGRSILQRCARSFARRPTTYWHQKQTYSTRKFKKSKNGQKYVANRSKSGFFAVSLEKCCWKSGVACAHKRDWEDSWVSRVYIG